MGFFSKKKSGQSAPAPAPSTGTYVAPQQADDVEMGDVKADGSVAPMAGTTNGGENTSVAISEATQRNENLTVAPDPAPEPSITPTAASAAAAPTMDSESTNLEPRQTTFEDPSVYTQRTSRTMGTFQTRGTMGTMATYPTVKTVDTEESKDSAFTITKNGQYLTLNGFANGHLMRWKFASEEGPTIIRIPAVILAIATIATTLYPILTIKQYWTIPILICAFHTILMSLMIIILDGRALGTRSPTNFRGVVRGIVTRYLTLTRLLWGRGLLYLATASMNLTIDSTYVLFSAIPMVLLGIAAIGSGAHASYNLDKMKSSLTDEAFLYSKFGSNDPDQDNYIDLEGFAELLWSLGLEFDDVYTYKAFQQIDKDSDGKISFSDFKHWWIITQTDGKRLS